MTVGINAQAGALTMADVPDLRRFAPGGALAILDWPVDAAALLAVLDAAQVPVTMFRWCTDPRGWPGWPRDYIARCPWAVLANESDQEGPLPDWYGAVADIWHAVNGLLCEPAWSDESKRRPDGWDNRYSAVSAHVYPLWRGAANLAAVRARANGRPVFVTEFGVAGQQQTCLRQIAAMGIVEPVWLYTYRARDAQAQPAYDLAGIALLPANAPQSRGNAPTAPDSPQGATSMQGVDISNVNGPVDMAALATAVRFVAIKASEGSDWPDPTFAANWAAAGSAGLVKIGYHFARPDLGNTPQAEAAYFLSRLPTLQPGDCLALDLELGTGDLSGWALAWLQAVEAAVGFKPLLYTYPSFLTDTGLGTADLAAYPLWYASYQAERPPTPGRWESLTLWQYSDGVTVPGVGAPVDGDTADLTIDQLRALGKPAPAPAPAALPTEGLNEMIQITPAITAAARARLGALGQHLVPGGAIEKELVARFALGQANPALATLTPTPVVGGETALPDGRAYAMLDSGEVLEYQNGHVDNPEETHRAAIVAQCWGGRLA